MDFDILLHWAFCEWVIVWGRGGTLLPNRIKVAVNPSGPDVIFYTYPPRGGEFSPPLVKWCFTTEKLRFFSCGEILQNFSMISMSYIKLKPNFQRIFKSSCLRFSKISTYSQIEILASYIPLKDTKIIEKSNFFTKIYDLPKKIMKT